MKAEELRIGNWVKDENGPYQIKGEHLDEDNFPTIQTWEIPLTQEWLLKFGFEFKAVGSEFIGHNMILHNWLNSREYVSWGVVKLKYVHQLQNLYFALTGRELTLKDNL
jgi:hypothetical protein